jgi:hypothetical protein
MKKYKVHFAISNLFGETQSEISKIQAHVKAATATIATSTYISANAEWAMIVGGVGYALDTLLCMVFLEEVKTPESK